MRPAERIGAWPFEAVTVGFPTGGFDGQFYYVVARDPWHPAPAAFLDDPAYRHARILYPAAAWLASGGGGPRALVWAMPLVNLAAVGGLAAVGVRLARHGGRNRWWGFALPLAVNAGAPLLRDLTDPVANLATAGLLAAWLTAARPWAVAAWGAAAVLAREQNLAVVGLVFVGAAVQNKWGAAAAAGAAAGVAGAWAAAVRSMYGAWPATPAGLIDPLAGLSYRWTHLTGASGVPVHLAMMLHLTAQLALSLALPLYGASRTAALVAGGGAALALLGGVLIYQDGPSYTRVFGWMPLGIWLWAVQSGRRWPLAVLLPAALWPCLGVLKAWRP